MGLVIEERVLVPAGTVNTFVGATNHDDGTAQSPKPFSSPPGAIGALFFFSITAISGTTPSVVFKIQTQDQFGNWVDVPGVVTASLTATGQTLLLVFPGTVEAANAKVSYVTPERFRVVATVAGTGPSVTYGVGIQFLE